MEALPMTAVTMIVYSACADRIECAAQFLVF
jgi:hypothetical protein